jgi:hypothetical protein
VDVTANSATNEDANRRIKLRKLIWWLRE